MLRGSLYALCRTFHTANVPRQFAIYKSQYSIDKLYPTSVAESSSTVDTSKIPSADGKTFTGFIPLEDLQITYSRSSGPGGQHVNKVNSKVEIRFHVDSAKWIPPDIKSKLISLESGRITKDGYFIVRSEKTRSQLLNQADCLDRLRTMIRESAIKPHVPTEEDLDSVRRRQDKARAAMLREKKSHSLKKQSRQAPANHDI